MSDLKRGIAFGILYTHLQDFTHGANPFVAEAAREWFYSALGGYGSFSWCCNELDLTVDGARKMLKELPPDKLAQTLKQFVEEEEQHERTEA